MSIKSKIQDTSVDASNLAASVKSQNLYLFNYIHKLEYLIMQSCKERAKSASKYKAMVSHIIKKVDQNNLLTKDAYKVLKLIEAMPEHKIDEDANRPSNTEDSHQKDTLYKTLNYRPQSEAGQLEEAGMPTNYQGLVEPRLKELDTAETLATPLDLDWINTESSKITSANRLQTEPRNSNLEDRLIPNSNEEAPKSSRKHLKSTQALQENTERSKYLSYMKSEWNHLSAIQREIPKRKRQVKLELKEESKHGQGHAYPSSMSFSVDMFNNLEIQKKAGSQNLLEEQHSKHPGSMAYYPTNGASGYNHGSIGEKLEPQYRQDAHSGLYPTQFQNGQDPSGRTDLFRIQKNVKRNIVFPNEVSHNDSGFLNDYALSNGNAAHEFTPSMPMREHPQGVPPSVMMSGETAPLKSGCKKRGRKRKNHPTPPDNFYGGHPPPQLQ